MACPICQKRKPERFCPAKGEKICALCCGTEREVTIDCPSHCRYLAAAHRYEEEHRKGIAPEEVAFPDAHFPADLIHERRPAVSGLGYAILKFAAAQPALVDPEVIAALQALAETYRTLSAGLYYEKPPGAALSHGLYGELVKFIQEFKQQDAERSGLTGLKDSEIFYLLVFLLRLARYRTNGRPRARGFLQFLRGQYPQAAELSAEPPRIILP